VAGYLTEGFGFSAFVQDAGAVYQTYPTTSRGIEFLKGYYGFSTRCRKAGRGREWQTWIHCHDEYDRD